MFRIRSIAIALSLTVMLCSCKKAIQDQKEKYVLGVMTTGRWYLENYTEYGLDKTFDFIAYEFQFFDDSKINAITATTVKTGTWQGNPSTLTMTIQFPPDDPTLNRISYPWLFTDSHIGLVFAETTTASGKITIRLRKKP